MNRALVPGTHEPDWIEPRLLEVAVPASMRRAWHESGARGLKRYAFGDCTILLAREPIGASGEMLWHLTISAPERHPTWDEIKTARYRLLPLDRCFGILLPPPEQYVNVPEQDHVFHVHEVRDAREPWTSG